MQQTANFAPVVVMNPTKEPKPLFTAIENSFPLIISPMIAPMIGPTIIPIGENIKPKMSPRVHPIIPAFPPPNFFVNHIGRK